MLFKSNWLYYLFFSIFFKNWRFDLVKSYDEINFQMNVIPDILQLKASKSILIKVISNFVRESLKSHLPFFEKSKMWPRYILKKLHNFVQFTDNKHIILWLYLTILPLYWSSLTTMTFKVFSMERNNLRISDIVSASQSSRTRQEITSNSLQQNNECTYFNLSVVLFLV